jgi:hypothetical protein
MTALFGLAVLVGIVVLLLLLDWGALTWGAESRPGFGGDDSLLAGTQDVRRWI